MLQRFLEEHTYYGKKKRLWNATIIKFAIYLSLNSAILAEFLPRPRQRAGPASLQHLPDRLL